MQHLSPKTGSRRNRFLSQSGALGAAVLNSLRETDIKFAHFISVGNKADVNENDVLRFWQMITTLIRSLSISKVL